MALRISLVAPVWYPVPPPGYGGIETVVSLLADGLAARGHDVTLFASGDSRTAARLVSPVGAAPGPVAGVGGEPALDAYHSLAAYQGSVDADVIHDHAAFIGPALGALADGPPVVHTVHGPWTDTTRRFYRLVADRVHLVAISGAQRAESGGVPHHAVVPNGIDVGSFPCVPRDEREDYLVFIGRSGPQKRPDAAIEVARRAGAPLKLVTKRKEQSERRYWDERVAPMLGPDVEVLEGLGHDDKAAVLCRARAMVFPIDWSEPFGLVMVEAMACGTPVVASPSGAATEVVEEGVSGRLCPTLEGMAEAVSAIDDISAEGCRAWVERRYSAEAMTAGYLELYEALVERRSLATAAG